MIYAPSNREEFQVFANWVNVKTTYGAVGDGTTDDTAAIQDAYDDLGVSYFNLYFPPGNYRITSTITAQATLHTCVMGDHPSTTRIFWDGAFEGRMFHLNGVSYSHRGRIHYDGMGIALDGVAREWDGVTGFAVTYNEHCDEWYSNFLWRALKGGLVLGQDFMDAETTVKRCRFYKCGLGVGVNSLNALDWWIWDCYFEKCTIGVSNDGGGNFHVYNSVFKKSILRDIEASVGSFFGIRNNWSKDSARFFHSVDRGGSGGLFTLQGNTILDTVSNVAISCENRPQLHLIDNIIRSKPSHTSGTVVYCRDDLFAIGNTFTASNHYDVGGKSIVYDESTVAYNTIDVPEPKLQATPKKQTREVYEVSTTNTAASLNAGIAWAADKKGEKPILHFNSGDYNIDTMVTIPAGDIQLVGSGLSTRLIWTGPPDGTMLRWMDAKRNTAKFFEAFGGASLKGRLLHIRHKDVLNKLIYTRAMYATSASVVGILIEKFENATLECHDVQYSENLLSLKLIGTNSLTGGKVNIFSGASSESGHTYSLEGGGKLLVCDIWYEATIPEFINLTGSGTLTINSSKIHTEPPYTPEAIVMNGFNGKVTIMSALDGRKIIMQGDGSNLKVLVMGVLFDRLSESPYYSNTSTGGEIRLLNIREGDGNSNALANVGAVDETYITEMVDHLRTSLHEYKTKDIGFFLHRVISSNCKKSFHFTPDWSK